MYDDGRVACTDDGLLIRHYYFPAGSKRIPYRAISEVRRTPLSALGRGKIHGSSDLVHWYSFDPRRPRKHSAFVIDLGRWVKPVLTPDDPDRVTAELAAHGVRVASDPGS
jgi:hypothetical protein